MKISPVLALLTVCAPMAVPIAAHAQTDVPMMQTLPMAPASAATSDAFVWRFAPPVGSRWTMRSFVRSTSLAQMPAMGGNPAESASFKMIQKLTADYDVLSRDALGATTIRMTLREMTSDLSTTENGKTVRSPAGKNADPKAVDGATLTIKQSRDGKVWGVVGMRAFQRKILQASGVVDEAAIKQAMNANLYMSDNSEWIKSLSMASGTLPISPVRLGESWNYDVRLPAPLQLDISGTRTLKQLDAEVAVVADSATYAGGKPQMKIPISDGSEAKQIQVDYSQLRGAVSGVSRVQRSSGLPLESTVTQTIDGSISTQMPAMNGARAQKITVPMKVTSSGRVVLEPR